MSREEEIIQEANTQYGVNHPFIDIARESFIEGAQWADKTMIDKACQWLNNEFLQEKDRDGYPNVESRSCISVEELIQDFRKAMEE